MASPLPTHLDPFTYNTEQAIAALSPHLHPCDAVSFRENEITGRTMLLAITITTLKTELGIVPFGRRELIVGEIKKMRRQSPLYHEHVRAMAAATPLPAPDDNEDFELEPDYSEDDVDKYIQQPVRRFTGSQFASLLNDIPPLGLQFRESPVCIRFLPENDDSESMVINTDGDLVVPEPILQTCPMSSTSLLSGSSSIGRRNVGAILFFSCVINSGIGRSSRSLIGRSSDSRSPVEEPLISSVAGATVNLFPSPPDSDIWHVCRIGPGDPVSTSTGRL